MLFFDCWVYFFVEIGCSVVMMMHLVRSKNVFLLPDQQICSRSHTQPDLFFFAHELECSSWITVLTQTCKWSRLSAWKLLRRPHGNADRGDVTASVWIHGVCEAYSLARRWFASQKEKAHSQAHSNSVDNAGEKNTERERRTVTTPCERTRCIIIRAGDLPPGAQIKMIHAHVPHGFAAQTDICASVQREYHV